MVSVSGYYAWRKRPESNRQREDRNLSQEIIELFNASRKRYGSVRIHKALKKQGRSIGRGRVIRLMQGNNLAAVAKRKFKATTDSNHSFPVAPNKLNQDFNVRQANTVYAGDITYIRTNEGWLY